MQTLDLKPEAKRTDTHPHTHTPAVRLLLPGEFHQRQGQGHRILLATLGIPAG